MLYHAFQWESYIKENQSGHDSTFLKEAFAKEYKRMVKTYNLEETPELEIRADLLSASEYVPKELKDFMDRLDLELMNPSCKKANRHYLDEAVGIMKGATVESKPEMKEGVKIATTLASMEPFPNGGGNALPNPDVVWGPEVNKESKAAMRMNVVEESAEATCVGFVDVVSYVLDSEADEERNDDVKWKNREVVLGGVLDEGVVSSDRLGRWSFSEFDRRRSSRSFHLRQPTSLPFSPVRLRASSSISLFARAGCRFDHVSVRAVSRSNIITANSQAPRPSPSFSPTSTNSSSLSSRRLSLSSGPSLSSAFNVDYGVSSRALAAFASSADWIIGLVGFGFAMLEESESVRRGCCFRLLGNVTGSVVVMQCAMAQRAGCAPSSLAVNEVLGNVGMWVCAYPRGAKNAIGALEARADLVLRVYFHLLL
ncbi:hypothetical protein M422DRAFT_261790 [Sphaerobolus stellatus SS14]|uniref:Uncharacterized protein n=1 Tax=Sphaerobolus stellatus (strain SS14) TaxID=990650 RepID=A0A0C9ULU0_SPHS4|nr:hypothetical protein M422DRAFT_261790 [Sphaerobolus stellatus SS14]